MDLVERYLQAVKHWLPTDRGTTSSRSCPRTSAPQIEEREASSGDR